MSNEFKAFATATPGTANSLTPVALAALTTLLADPGVDIACVWMGQKKPGFISRMSLS